MKENNKKKKEILGEDAGTASNKLKKKIMFHLIKKLNENICFQCGKEIADEKELSIEHKIPWLDKGKDLFYDINNIAFSHLSCNIKASRKAKQRYRETKSKYKGVKNPEGRNKFRAFYTENGKSKAIGSFNTAKEAAIAYDKKAIELYKDKAITNKKLGLL